MKNLKRILPKCLPAGPVRVPEVSLTVRKTSDVQDHAVSRYLLALGRLCVEVAHRPTLLPVFVAIVKLVPGTIMSLQRVEGGCVAISPDEHFRQIWRE
jgi:hypothetical protein